MSAEIPSRFHDATFEFHNPIEVSDEDYGRMFESRIEEDVENDRKKAEDEAAAEEKKRSESKSPDEADQAITTLLNTMTEQGRKLQAEKSKSPERVEGIIDEDAILRHAEAGESVGEIAILFNITRDQVYDTLAKHGRRLKKKRFGRDDVGQAKEDLTKDKLKELGIEEEDGESTTERIRNAFPLSLQGGSETKTKRKSTGERGYTGSSSLWEKDLD